jgi:hypothetical protein
MKKKFIDKAACLAVCALLLSPQLKADNVKTDYTDLLENPSFELTTGGEPITSSTTLPIRYLPYGWSHTVIYDGSEISWDSSDVLGQSYGVNKDGAAVTMDGSFNLFKNSSKPLDLYELYQEITVGNGTGQLPPGEYIISCRMVVTGTDNTGSRFTTQRLFAKTETQNKVCYYGKASDYGTNLTSGEDAVYAGWLSDGTTASTMGFKPLSLIISVTEGETLRLGIKTNNKGKDGTTYTTGSAVGMFRADYFHIEKTTPNDYTASIVNPNFELQEEGLVVQATTANSRGGNTPVRFAPYGWTHLVVKEYDANGKPIVLPWTDGERQELGQAVGVNYDVTQLPPADGHYRGLYSFFMNVSNQPLYEYTLWQDVKGLPAGKYHLTCFMLVTSEQRHCTQRLFANDQVQFFGEATDYNLAYQLSYDEKEKYDAGQLAVNYAGYAPNADNFKLMSLDVDVEAGGTLTLGLKTSNVQSDGTIKSGQHVMRIDNFRLELLELDSGTTKLAPAISDKVEKSVQYYTLSGIATPETTKGLLLKKISYTDGSVNVEKVIK